MLDGYGGRASIEIDPKSRRTNQKETDDTSFNVEHTSRNGRVTVLKVQDCLSIPFLFLTASLVLQSVQN